MSFITHDFAWFLPIVFGLWWLTRRRYAWHISLMLCASLIFYAFHHWWLLGIIGSYCIVDWMTALWLQHARRRRLTLAVGVSFNIVVLCFWKYSPLLVPTIANLLGRSDAAIRVVATDTWVVPMGISFYAFTGIAYMTDVYRGIIPAERNLWRYSLFTTFFPHLVAGPILRAREFLTHLGPDTLPERPLAPMEATFLIARGFFRKLILADSIAAAIDPFFVNIAHPSTAGVWALPYVYLYAFQIYFDFAGYTDIARGLGLWFGFRWPENFNNPYLATSVREFWRRWHMTLSRFLRDYLYVPLGGNRLGPWRSALNLMITMMLGGLWHGASWSFLLWGGLHGLFLVVNRVWASCPMERKLAHLSGLGRYTWTATRVVLTFNIVCLTWCFFRLTTFGEGLICLRQSFVFDLDKLYGGGIADTSLWLLLATYTVTILAAAMLTRGLSLAVVVDRVCRSPFARGMFWGSALGLLFVSVFLARRSEVMPFIYFQF